ncbi:hypothetical protein SedNR2807_28620 [Citrobacter sedlakii]
MAFNYRATAPFDEFALLCRDLARIEVRICQLRPDCSSPRFKVIDLGYPDSEGITQLTKESLYVTHLRAQFFFHLADRRFVIDR